MEAKKLLFDKYATSDELVRVMRTTVVRENFGVKKFSDAQLRLEIKYSKYFL